MEDPQFTVYYNYDDPTANQQFNNKGNTYFPSMLFSQTGFILYHYAQKYDSPVTRVVEPYDLSDVTEAKLYIKVANSIMAPIEIADGVVEDDVGGEISFTVPKDTISNALATYYSESTKTPIVLYFVITDSANEKKISLETHLRIMDINRNGTEDAIQYDASEILYSVEQSAKWTPYYGEPTGVAEALDKIARISRTDFGKINSIEATQPGSPTDGAKYIASATAGDWTDKYIYEWNDIASAWLEYTPSVGDEVYNVATSKRMRFNGTIWLDVDSFSNNEFIPDNNGNELLQFGVTASAFNHIKITNKATGNSPTIEAAGGDTNIDLVLGGKGSGKVKPSSIVDMNSKMLQQSIGANIASASTLTIGTDGNSFTVTGTTTITEFSAVKVGTQITLYFSGSLTLTYHATNLILPTSTNIQTEAGDYAIFEEYASGDWICIGYFRKSGIPLVGVLAQYRNIIIPASAFISAVTNGARIAPFESTTNKNNLDGFDFDASTEQYIQCNFPFPDDWDLSTIKAKFHWTNGDTAGSGDVIWGLQGVAVSNDDALDVAFGTAQEVTDAFISSGVNHVTNATSSITIAGSPVLDDLIQLRVYRKAADGSDTYNQKARLLAISLQYRTKSTLNTAW